MNNPPQKKIAPCCQRLSSPAMPEKISDSESSFRIFPGTPGQNKIHTSGTFLTCELVSLMQSTFCMHKNSHACTLLFPSVSKYNTCASASSVYCISALDLIECMHWIMHCKSQPFFQGPLLVEMCNIANPLKNLSALK